MPQLSADDYQAGLAERPLSIRIGECARRLDEGEPTDWRDFFELAAPRLLRYAMTLMHQTADAEDALQATFTRVARNPRAVALARNPWAYLLQMTRNESLRLLASRRVKTRSWDDPPAASADPEGLELEERREDIQSCLRRLPADQAEVVVLKLWEDMTFQEIAALTGESLNTVASRYRYALAKLSHRLQRWADGVVHETRT